MDIQLKDTANNKLTDSLVLPAELKDMPTNWNFNWRELFKSGGMFFKIVLTQSPGIVEGVLMVTLIDGEYIYLNNLESAPHNIGQNKKYDFVAGCLLAYACKLSFNLSKKAYKGFVSFNSKTKLVPLYRDKYGATHIGGQKMFFSALESKRLMNQYLKE